MNDSHSNHPIRGLDGVKSWTFNNKSDDDNKDNDNQDDDDDNANGNDNDKRVIFCMEEVQNPSRSHYA
jgi:hypothetical protein